MVPARDTAAGVAAGAGTSGETVFRRGAGAGGAARVDPLLRRIRGLTRFDRVSCGRWLREAARTMAPRPQAYADGLWAGGHPVGILPRR